MPAYGLGAYGQGVYGIGELETPALPPEPTRPETTQATYGRQTLPEILLRVPGSSWPTSPGLPVGTGRCDTLRLDREIVAASLPGQVRGKTGFSIGDASAAVPQPRRQFVPWSRSTDRRIGSGAEAELVAWDEITNTETPLGRWRVAKPAGALTSGQVTVDLDESQARGRLLPNRLPTIAGPVDPVWIIDQLARQMGYYSTPTPGPSTVLDVPLTGAMTPQAGGRIIAGDGAVWNGSTGAVGLDSGTAVLPVWQLTGMPEGPFRVAFNGSATVAFRMTQDEASTWVQLQADGAGVLGLSVNGSSPVTVPYVPGLNADWPQRVEIEVDLAGTSVRARARTTDDEGAWSARATLPLPPGIATLTPDQVALEDIGPGGVSALRVASGPTSWAPATARLSPLGGLVAAPWVPATQDVWTALQGICDAWGAILVKTNDDRLVLLNRHEAAGAGRPKTTIDVDRMADDIRWSVVADDYADRLTTTWHPVTWPDEFTDPPEWPVAERLHVPADGSISVDVDLGGYVQSLAGFDPSAASDGSSSEWEANTAADGFGADVTAGISVAVDHPSPARATVTVTNSTTTDVWMTTLILRGAGAAIQDEEATITRGAAEHDAVAPLTIDLGYTVQTRDDAEALTSYLWERVNRPRFRVEGVRLPLDWSRDLGDLLLLDHPRSELWENALVVGIHIDTGNAGMTVDLVALPPTWSDFDAAWAGKTGPDFDNAWAGRTGTAFDTDPLRTEA